MRDIAITAIVLGLLPWILREPRIGVLTWAWISYMNPHRLSWGFAYNFPFAEIVAATTLLGLVVSKEKKAIPWSGLVNLWLVFIVWMGVSTLLAIFPEHAWMQYEKILKIQLFTFIILMIMGTKERLNALTWVTMLSFGFFSVKGGIFTILTGGQNRVWGPAGSFIGDNNSLALASLMTIPLMFYLFQTSTKTWIRMGLVGAMILSLAATLGSQSRGAMLATLCVGFFLTLKSRHKAAIGLSVLILIPLAFSLMPKEWHKRMDTIEHYQQDRSAMGRINAWHYAVNVASHRLTGAGLNSWSKQTFAKYAPDPTDVHAAHSIYFSVLGDHGWPGLLMFIAIIVLSWRRGTRAIMLSKGRQELTWVSDMAKMLQVSLVAYLTGGAFLSLSYFDFPWQIYAMLILLERHAARYRAEEEANENAALESPLDYGSQRKAFG